MATEIHHACMQEVAGLNCDTILSETGGGVQYCDTGTPYSMYSVIDKITCTHTWLCMQNI